MHTLPQLPYPYNSLEPYIDELTMRIHHTKHHQAYIDKLNGAVKGTNFEKIDVDELIKNLNGVPENIRAIIRNHGGGHSNHTFFWKIMAPNAGGDPTGNVGNAIKQTFGGFDNFKQELTNAGLNRFGSGWAWLVVNNGKLEVYSTANQDSPLMEGKTPILGVDVWEHSYYLLYNQRRADYLTAFFNVINWKQVEDNFNKTVKK